MLVARYAAITMNEHDADDDGHGLTDKIDFFLNLCLKLPTIGILYAWNQQTQG